MQTIRIENRTIFRILISTGLFLLAIKVIVLLQTPLLWIGAAFFLAVALNPAVSFFSKYLPRQSRGGAIAVVLLTFFVVTGFLVYSFLPPLITQTQALINSIPGFIAQLQNLGGPFGDLAQRFDLGSRLSEVSGDIVKGVSSATGSALNLIANVFSGVAAVLTIFALTFFMLFETKTWMHNFWALTPPAHRERNRQLATQMYNAVTGYVNGNFLTSLIAAVTAAIMMFILGVPYAIPLAMVVGLLDLVPLVGATVAAVIVVLVALSESSVDAIILAVYFVVYQQIENNILQPLVYGRSTELSPLVVTIAILIGATLAGIFGALVAIPIAACIKVILFHFYGDRLQTPSDARRGKGLKT
jgi:predicted PurR-regulated permease PerM